jgi:5-methylcytosine-specific restriction endonuclease McrA
MAFPAKDVQVDHIHPIIDPSVGFESWDETIDRMFCEKNNLQVLCTNPCHKSKTAAEKQQAKERRNDQTKV